MGFTGAADRADVSGGFGQGETRPQAFTGLNGRGYVIGRIQDRIIEIADISDPDTTTYVSAVIGNPNSMAAHNGSLYVFIGRDLIRFDTPFSDTDTGTDVFTITQTPRALTSDGTNLYYIHQESTLNFLYRIDDLDSAPTAVALGRVGNTVNIRGFVWHDGFFWGADATSDRLVKIILNTENDDPHTVENVGSYSQFVGPIVNPQGFGIVDGVGYIAALDNDGSLWELRDFKFTSEIADQSWTVGTAVSISAPATEDGETPITYAISPALPAGVTLDTSTGGISGTPTATDDATDYTITATDDNGIEATTTFSASVAASGGITNNAPSFQDASYSFSDVAIVVNTVVGTVAATDADDDILTYSLTGTDASKFDIDSDGQITVDELLEYGESYAINVVADDQTDTTTVAVTINADTTTPRAPTIAEDSTTHNSVTIDITAGDDGGEAVTDWEYELDGDSTWNAFGSTDLEQTISNLESETTYSIKIRGVNSEGNGIASTALSTTTDAAAAAMPPTFTAPASDYEVNERADATIDSTEFFSGHTGIAFKSGTTAPSWATISGLNVVITDAPDVLDDTDYDIQLTATNDDGDVDSTITVSIQQIDPAPVIGTLTRIDISEGQSDTVDLSGDLQNTDTLVITSSQSWVSVSGLSLVITNAPNVNSDTDYTVNLRAESDATSATDTGSVVIRVAQSSEIDTVSLANQTLILFEKERNHTTTPSEAGDNDRSTSTTETTVECEIDDADGNDTEFDHIRVMCSGVDSYNLSVDGTTQGTRTLPTEIQVTGAEPAIDDVSITRDGWQHDLLALETALTGSTVTLTFTGTDVKINEVLILKKPTVANQNYTQLSHAKTDINSSVDQVQSGEVSRTFSTRGDRLRWRSNLALEFVNADEDAEAFLSWIDENPDIVVAHDPHLYPWRTYKAKWLENQYNVPYLSKVVEDGVSVPFQIQENRPIGAQLAVNRKETFNSEDAKEQYLFFNHCQHLRPGRVTTPSGSIERKASDNKYKTYSTQTTLIFDISKNDEATKVSHIWLKATGVTSYDVQTLVSNTWTTQETITPTQTNYASWDNSLEKLTTAITDTSVRLVFSGSSIKISEVMLLHHAGGLDAMQEISPLKMDRNSVASESDRGEVQNRLLGSDRLKWELDFSAVFTGLHISEDFIDWADANPNFTFAERPESKPWRVYPATFLNDAFNISLLSDTIQIGEVVDFQTGER